MLFSELVENRELINMEKYGSSLQHTPLYKKQKWSGVYLERYQDHLLGN